MMGYDVAFGAVHFDDVSEHSAGYYARAGDKAKRLSANKCGDLATDVVWLTNLNYETMRSAHMYPHAKYRRNDFLGETYKNILGRLGFFDEKDAVICQEGVEHLASLFERVMRYAHVYGNFETVPMYNLRTGFREKFSRIDPQVTPDLLKALQEAESYFTSVERPASDAVPAWLPLYLPPWEHCMALLSQPLPAHDAEWKQVAPRLLPKTREDIENWAHGIGLAKVALADFSPGFSEMINFGSNPARGRNQRRWTTFEELSFLNQVCEARVEAAWIANKIASPLEYREIAERMPQKHHFSLSGMLFLQNLWSAPGQSYTGGLRGPLKNTRSPFLRCYDRLLCLNEALKVRDAGLEVVGYGSCKVYINCASVRARDVLSVCRKVGLVPPLCAVEISEDTETINLEDPLAIQQTLWGRGALSLIMDYDKICYEELLQ